ncbi:MAG: transposase family protein, partial [Holosporales bacterium]|nr:transposase family protein [Holosporales bacterium]
MQVIITSLVVFVILSRFYGAALSIKLHRKRLVLDHFSDIEDPRESWNQFYSVQELLFLTVSAVIAGADGWR